MVDGWMGSDEVEDVSLQAGTEYGVQYKMQEREARDEGTPIDAYRARRAEGPCAGFRIGWKLFLAVEARPNWTEKLC